MKMVFRQWPVALALLGAALAPSAHAAVFINELHYDNSAKNDPGEGIEVMATAGEDLRRYRIVLYNGAQPQAAVSYATLSLDAGTPAQCGIPVRIATVRANNLIQNGPNDGLALVDGDGRVVQFLSYEGQVSAIDGPAAGLASTDIGVSEDNRTAPGTSLQRGNDGRWRPSAPATFGRCNHQQRVDHRTTAGDPPARSAPAAASTGAATGKAVDAATYWAGITTRQPAQLRCALHQTIKGHTVYPYSGRGTSTWTILELADQDPRNPENVLDLYRNRSYPKVAGRSGTGKGLTYNREHTWPKSLGFPSPTDDSGRPYAPYTDAHMLYLADANYNSSRSNKALDNCRSGCTALPTERQNGQGGGKGRGDSNWSGEYFEVWDARKGDIARALMYMAIRYEGGRHPVTGQREPDLELTDDMRKVVMTAASPAWMGRLSTLLAWHRADPPTAAERARNDVVQRFQGNRNPFIDHPEWATEALFATPPASNCAVRG